MKTNPLVIAAVLVVIVVIIILVYVQSQKQTQLALLQAQQNANSGGGLNYGGIVGTIWDKASGLFTKKPATTTTKTNTSNLPPNIG